MTKNEIGELLERFAKLQRELKRAEESAVVPAPSKEEILALLLETCEGILKHIGGFPKERVKT